MESDLMHLFTPRVLMRLLSENRLRTSFNVARLRPAVLMVKQFIYSRTFQTESSVQDAK